MADQDREVVKWFTRARRFPKLIGKTHEGTRIPGGPYTITQVMVGAGLFALLAAPPRPWAVFGGLLPNLGFFVLVVVGGVFLSGRLPIGMRNPLIWVEGLVRVSSHRPIDVRLPAPRQVRGSAVMVVGPGLELSQAASAPELEPVASPSSSVDEGDAPAGGSSTSPQPVSFTGVQRLLAASVSLSKE